MMVTGNGFLFSENGEGLKNRIFLSIILEFGKRKSGFDTTFLVRYLLNFFPKMSV